MKITRFDKKSLGAIGSAMEKAMQSVAEEFGVQLKVAGGSFREQTASLKFDVALLDTSGAPVRKERIDFEKFGSLYGLEGMLDREFVVDGRKFTISGLRSNARKNPVIATRDDGRDYIFGVADIKKLCGQAEA